VLPGCHGSKRRAQPSPEPALSFLALDAQQQRLVAAYEPVSRALTTYERAHRDWRARRLAAPAFRAQVKTFRVVVRASLRRLRQVRVSGETRAAKRLLADALVTRRDALGASLAGERLRYQQQWDHAVVLARQGLTKLQDIRDRARLIPLPEDSVS
jgi:hypothetical protein